MLVLVPKYTQKICCRTVNDVMEMETRFLETCFRFHNRHYGNGNVFLGKVFPFPHFVSFTQVCLWSIVQK